MVITYTLIFQIALTLVAAVFLLSWWTAQMRSLYTLLKKKGIPIRFHKPYSSNSDTLSADEIIERTNPFKRAYWSPLTYLTSDLDNEDGLIKRKKQKALRTLTLSLLLFLILIIEAPILTMIFKR